MNQPVITAGAIAGLILAGWDIIVKQGMLEFLRPDAQNATSIFVNLLVPIVAAVIAARFVTPVSAPSLALGTLVTTPQGEPDGVVTAKPV